MALDLGEFASISLAAGPTCGRYSYPPHATQSRVYILPPGPSRAQNVGAGGYSAGQVNRDTGRIGFVMANYDNSGSRGGSGPQRATVKWFNSTKGFGFVTLEDGSDAFCHASALSALSSPDLPQGATVYCDVAQGQRGMQVTTVHSVDLSTAE